MQYRIGDLAKTIGMPVNAIRFYEKYGIVEPERAGDGNFRSYGELDLYRLLFAKYFRSMDFSLEKTAELVGKSSRSEQYAALEAQLETVRAELSRLETVERCIEEELCSMKFADELKEDCRVVELPGMYWLFSHSEKRDFPRPDVDIELTDRIMSRLPELHFYCLIAREVLEQPDDVPFSCRWGVAFEEDKAQGIAPDDLARLVYLPPQRYAALSVDVNQDCIITREMFRRQRAFCAERGYGVGQTAIAALHCGEFLSPGKTRAPVVCYLPLCGEPKAGAEKEENAVRL